MAGKTVARSAERSAATVNERLAHPVQSVVAPAVGALGLGAALVSAAAAAAIIGTDPGH